MPVKKEPISSRTLTEFTFLFWLSHNDNMKKKHAKFQNKISSASKIFQSGKKAVWNAKANDAKFYSE